MDRPRLRRRMRIILAVGGILIALAYVGPMAPEVRSRWQALRNAADREASEASLVAGFADEASREAEQLRQEGRMSEAERWAQKAEEYRQIEAHYRRKSQELLRRWW
jgi:AraC-like DNA-binding protein